MNCRISRSLLEAVDGHCRLNPARESCGLLLGADGEIRAAVPVPNRASNPRHGFVLDERAHLAAARAARRAGMRILGHYHWHPSGSALPSARDRAEADRDGVYWMILAAGDRRLWLSRRGGAEGGAFDPVTLSLCKALPCQLESLGPIGAPGTSTAAQGR